MRGGGGLESSADMERMPIGNAGQAGPVTEGPSSVFSSPYRPGFASPKAVRFPVTLHYAQGSFSNLASSALAGTKMTAAILALET